MDQLQQLVETLRALARTSEPNRVALIEKAIDEYPNDKAGIVRLSLERLWNAIEPEEADRRAFEDWSIATFFIRGTHRRSGENDGTAQFRRRAGSSSGTKWLCCAG
jgi:hypothetical protein